MLDPIKTCSEKIISTPVVQDNLLEKDSTLFSESIFPSEEPHSEDKLSSPLQIVKSLHDFNLSGLLTKEQASQVAKLC